VPAARNPISQEIQIVDSVRSVVGMKIPQAFYSNCYFGTFYLLLRGKVSEVVGVDSESALTFCHFIALNKNGHAIHFMHSLPHRENRLAPFWFLGKWSGIRKSQQAKVLKKCKKRIRFRTKRVGLFVFIFHLIWLLLFVPWMVSWVLYPIVWNFYWWARDCPALPWNWGSRK
jgi:hypothetical protein